MRFAITHSVHGLAAQNFRQVLPLLRQGAEHHQGVGLDRGSDPWGLVLLHRLHESDLLQRCSCLATELLRPTETNPSGATDVEGKFSIELALRERPGIEAGLSISSPVLRKPAPDMCAQLVPGRA